MTLVAGIAMFFADDGANGVELWRSDGTAQGTTLVANIGAGSASYHSSYPDDYGAMPAIGTAVYFRAKEAVSGEELWRSDEHRERHLSGGRHRRRRRGCKPALHYAGRITAVFPGD